MFAKIFFASCLLTAIILGSPAARASDDNLMVHYDCDAAHNRLTVRTFVSDKRPWQSGKNDLPFISLQKVSMPLECSFLTGDDIFVKSYYGDGPAFGGFRHVAIYINNRQLGRLLEFDPDHTQAIRVTGDHDHTVHVHYSNK